MAESSVAQFAAQILESPALQRRLQTICNDLAAAIADAGAEQGHTISVEDVGQFLSETFYPDGSTPASPACDRRTWNPVLQKMLQNLKVTNANHQMFQTMSLDSMDDEGKSLLTEALKQAGKGSPAAAPAAPEPAQPAPAQPAAEINPWSTGPVEEPAEAVEEFEPDSAWPAGQEQPANSTASGTAAGTAAAQGVPAPAEVGDKLREVQRKLAEMDNLEQAGNKSSWWKVW